MTRAERLLRELIALPSVNPSLVREDHPHAGEWRVADFIAAWSARAGLDVDFQAVAPNRSNVLCRLSPSGRAKHRILLAPHLDTVPLASADQLVPSRKGTRLYGRGACDTKGSVAAMLMALAEMARQRRRPAETEILFAGLVDEEVEQAGSRALAASRLKADLAIVGEPTRLQVVTAHKGDLWLQLETLGRAAHGATPHLGKNAVGEMARVVDAMETGYHAVLSRRRHRLLGFPTASIGRIRGGIQPNIVPDQCTIDVDRRTLPGETDRSVLRELKTFLRTAGCRVTVRNTKVAACPPLETSDKLPWVRAFLTSAGQRAGVGVHFFCDAAVLNQGGIPSVVFGPGDIAQAHTANEWIALSQLERATAILVRYLKTLP